MVQWGQNIVDCSYFFNFEGCVIATQIHWKMQMVVDHMMMTSSNGNIFRVTTGYWPFVRGINRSPVNFTHKGQWRGNLIVFFYLRLNKRLNKQSWGWWFETQNIGNTLPKIIPLQWRNNGHDSVSNHQPHDCLLNEHIWISIRILLKFVPWVPIGNTPTLVQIMAWCLPGDKLLSEPMMVSLLTLIWVTRPKWVNDSFLKEPCAW